MFVNVLVNIRGAAVCIHMKLCIQTFGTVPNKSLKRILRATGAVKAECIIDRQIIKCCCGHITYRFKLTVVL